MAVFLFVSLLVFNILRCVGFSFSSLYEGIIIFPVFMQMHCQYNPKQIHFIHYDFINYLNIVFIYLFDY